MTNERVIHHRLGGYGLASVKRGPGSSFDFTSWRDAIFADERDDDCQPLNSGELAFLLERMSFPAAAGRGGWRCSEEVGGGANMRFQCIYFAYCSTYVPMY